MYLVPVSLKCHTIVCSLHLYYYKNVSNILQIVSNNLTKGHFKTRLLSSLAENNLHAQQDFLIINDSSHENKKKNDY